MIGKLEQNSATGEPAIGFIPWLSLWMSGYTGTTEEAKLKVATVFYDHLVLPVDTTMRDVLVTQWGKNYGIKRREVEDTYFVLNEVVPPSIAQTIHDKMWSTGDHPPSASLRELEKVAMKDLAESYNVSVEELSDTERFHPMDVAKDVWYGIFAATRAAQSACILSEHINTALVAFSELEVRAAKCHLFESHTVDVNDAYDEVAVHVPSIRNLPWNAVFALRRDSRVQEFRRWLWSRLADDSLPDPLINDLWSAVESLYPNTGIEVIKGIISNLPVPLPVNPIGLALSGKDIIKSKKFNDQKRLVMFMHQMRKFSTHS